jgi:queuine tRNA-ribosyltransferase
MFKEVKKHKNGSRQGLLTTRAASVKSPFFMPVATRGAVKSLEPEEVAATGAQVLLANTYHLHLAPGEKVIKKLGGLHSFTDWNGPNLTDSGGFQVFSLAHVRKITEDGVVFKDPASGRQVQLTPEKSIQIQLDLGADIIMAFDDLTGLDPKKAKVREAEAVERTHRWLLRCITEFNRLTARTPKAKRPLLFGIAQGGLDKKLRQKSVEFVQSTEVDGLAIGGLSVGEGTKQMHEMLEFLAPLYDVAKIRYLMGVGEPNNLRFAIEHGIDMFDCVLPTRNGRHGSVWISGDKKLNLNNSRHSTDKGPIDKTCDCYTCQQGYSRAFIRHLFKMGDPLAGKLASIHNLRYLQRICETYRSG